MRLKFPLCNAVKRDGYKKNYLCFVRIRTVRRGLNIIYIYIYIYIYTHTHTLHDN